MCNAKFGNKTNFIPHAFPPEIYHPIDDSEAKKYKAECLGPERKDDFVVLWVNRNAKRKRPNDLLLGWQKFINLIKEKYGKTDATLLMHTDPHDGEGPNLLATTEHLGIVPHVVYSNERIDFNQMRIIHNVVDCCVNISFAEGFGLATLESMLCGKPIIAVKTGGLTRQVVNHLDDSENGVALPVVLQSLVGSQTVPYIYEDYASTDDIASAFLKLYEMSPAERKKLGEKARNYALSEFSFDKTVELWNDTLKDTLENWKSTYNRVNCEEL
jgi:glycosyltransferase involved in cell wall biosynthesis